jgi:hypothetical protein
MQDDPDAQRRPLGLVALTMACLLSTAPLHAEGLLETIRHHAPLTSTVPDNADLNPYAVWVAPVSAGKVHAGDVLVDNFNNVSNLQGTGGSIIAYSPETKTTTLVAALPRQMPQCPGGVGLTAAMAMLRTGWIIVGSTPSTDGTTRTKGPGCLLVVSPDGQMVAAWTGPNINGPWSNMALVDHGTTASLFVTMAGVDAQTVTKGGATSANRVGVVIVPPPTVPRGAAGATPVPETAAGGTRVRVWIERKFPSTSLV